MTLLYSAYASVVLDLALQKTLDYGIPHDLITAIKPGVKVEVSVKGHFRTGYVLLIKDQPSVPRVQPISKIISSEVLIDTPLFDLALWMSKYYCVSLSKTLKIILPPSIRKETSAKKQLYVKRGKSREILRDACLELRNKYPQQADVLDVMLQVHKGILLTELLEETQGTRSPIETLAKKGLLIIEALKLDRSPLVDEEYFPTKAKQLNPEQFEVLNKITSDLSLGHFQTHLIHGVTGSGKTEIYLQAIERTLQLNKSAIVLVPEIALTMQMIERFRSRFEGKIAVLHHRLSQGERHDEWHRIRRGEAKIVIGARSAIFSPVVNLGLIIVDEEHENSYKQDGETPCYHARNVAVMRGKLSNAVVILGSATPSMESYYNAIKGKYCLSTLHSRADFATIPKVTLVDMNKEMDKAKGFTIFSDVLLTKIQDRYFLGEQIILFLNRRGYHTTLNCQTCQRVVKCLHCDVSLTYHKNENSISCHLCGYKISPPPSQCTYCYSPTIKFKGIGTEQVEKALNAIFPDIRTLRIDADTTKHKGSHQKLLRDFATGKADVLIGTQMIAKGLHFPQVTLVCVLNADAQLNIPDFRASENTFQLITQVAGRSGRGAIPGEVLIQTRLTENSTIQWAAQQNYISFFKEELPIRELFKFPPFSQIAKFNFSGKDEKKTFEVGNLIRDDLIRHLPNVFEILPLIPAGYAKVKDHFKFQFIVKGPSGYTLSTIVEDIQNRGMMPSMVKMSVDIDPLSTFF